MRGFFKRLFCEHEWVEIDNTLIDAGRNKIFWLECEKCGKSSTTTLDGHKKFKRTKGQ